MKMIRDISSGRGLFEILDHMFQHFAYSGKGFQMHQVTDPHKFAKYPDKHIKHVSLYQLSLKSLGTLVFDLKKHGFLR
jgi:hypothetical protein